MIRTRKNWYRWEHILKKKLSLNLGIWYQLSTSIRDMNIACKVAYAEESKLHIPNSLLKFENFSWFRGFVKISAIWFSELMKIILKLFLATSSLIKWCLILMYFVLECRIRFLDKLIALVLSHRMKTLPKSIE